LGTIMEAFGNSSDLQQETVTNLRSYDAPSKRAFPMQDRFSCTHYHVYSNTSSRYRYTSQF
jgi:hypothetical protein